MGSAKELWMEQAARAWDFADEAHVCPQCVSDETLRGLLTHHAQAKACTYCGALKAAPIEVLLDAIEETIQADYADPVDVLAYNGREGGYQGATCDGWDLVANHLSPWTENDELAQHAGAAFGQSCWCRLSYYGLTKHESLSYGWASFVEAVKHRTRFLFFERLESDDAVPGRDVIPPSSMLDALDLLFHDESLFRTLAEGTEFIRSRVYTDEPRPTGAAELGTAPKENAAQANRMSPAGIPMFYAAFNEDTAVLETLEPERGGSAKLVLAVFQTIRPLQLLDLTSIPAIPSDFAAETRAKRDPRRFLRDFAGEIGQPIERDGRAHVDYAPTQVVTEFVRYRMRTPDDSPIDGILYNSSRRGGAEAVVLFAEAEDCGPREREGAWQRECFLRLTSDRDADPAEFERLFT